MRSARKLALACALTALVGVLALPAPASAQEFHGINAQELFRLPQASWDRHLSLLARSGVRLVRRDAEWDTVEPAPPVGGRHTYDWSAYDRQVEALARHGLRWLPIIDYSARWAGTLPGDRNSPPRTGDYVAYAVALARRYGAHGSFWQAHPGLPRMAVTRYEVWNEPNAKRFWHPQHDAPERYADLYAATRAGLKSVDPAARVIVGGLALGNHDVMSEHEFVERMFRRRADLVGGVDAVALHPYAPDAAGVHARIRHFRRTLSRLGAGGLPLEITELGWTTTSASESHRAASLARLAGELVRSDCRVASMVPHTWLTAQLTPSNPEHWFGIANADGSLKPSGSAYLGAVNSVARQGAGARSKICGAGGSARGPALRLRLRGARRARRLTAIVRCRHCRVRLELFRRGRRPGSAARGRALASSAVSPGTRTRKLGTRRVWLGTRRRKVALRLPPGRRPLLLRAVAKRKHVAATTRLRKLTVSCRKSRGARARRGRGWRCSIARSPRRAGPRR